MNPRVRFDDEADAEYRLAGQWYEVRRDHLGIEFFDAVDATIGQIVAMPRAGIRVPRLPPDLPVRRRAVTRFPYHVVYLELVTHIRILAIALDRRRPPGGGPLRGGAPSARKAAFAGRPLRGRRLRRGENPAQPAL